ncbi:MAG: dipeptidase [Alicyclobacillaceae bacterium]|nr:dipeptidase [Alicyclobacillaceae bacterium]
MDFDSFLNAHRADHLERLQQFLRYPSISALSEHKADVRACAEFVAREAARAGLEHVQILETDGYPVVYADWLHAPGKATVLVYGHYDVQPVDPLDQWHTPPFDPLIRDGRIYARGASDDKGQVFMHLASFEALLKTSGSLPVNVKLCIEGEEEIGSPHLAGLLAQQLDRFRADAVVISDTTMLGPNRPAVCYGLRGLAGLQIDVRGPAHDLHSGLYGGGVQNPIHALVELLASMHRPDGRVAIEGFYDDVAPVSDEERRALAELGADEAAIAADLGVPALYGEAGYSFTERTWIRPTLEVNGIYGGFQGEGTKTVIPATAHAKITCRLVPNQDPLRILDLVEQHVQRHTPPGVTVSVTRRETGKPYVTPFDHPVIRAAAQAYERAYGTAASFTRMGGSIPIVETLDRLLQAPVVMMGFGLNDENFHAPNEHFSLENFDKGMRALCHLWKGLADWRP